MPGVSQRLACLPTAMLKKIFAKLRESMSPSRAKKPTPAEAAKPVSQSKAQSSSPRGEARHDPFDGAQGRRGAGHGPGAKSHDKYRGQPRDPRDEPHREPRAAGAGAGHDARPRRDDHGPRRDDHAGRGGSSSHGGRGLHSRSGGGGRGGPRGERERPMIDKTFDHPRTTDIKPAVPVDVPKMDTEFSKLGLSDALAFGVQEMGYVTPTPIQAQAIPVVLRGGDVIGSAQTGTGKTAAFALPVIQRLAGHGELRCLILEPTRELALQVEEAFQKYAKFTDLRVTIKPLPRKIQFPISNLKRRWISKRLTTLLGQALAHHVELNESLVGGDARADCGRMS